MGEPQRKGRPTRAESLDLERRMHEVAVDSFVRHGFDGTTMEAVAAAAGVTKRTLYARFPDKQALFSGVIPLALADMAFHGIDLDVPDGPLEEALLGLGRQIVARLVHPDAVRLRRLALLERDRIAGLDTTVGLDLWSQSVQVVVDLLHARSAQGEVVVDDVRRTADLFMAMVGGGPTMWADLGQFLPPDERERHLADAVRLFLQGVSPRR